MSFKIEVKTSDPEWSGNALRFATQPEAEGYAKDLYGRWMAVKETRVVEVVDEPVNYTFTEGRLVRLESVDAMGET